MDIDNRIIQMFGHPLKRGPGDELIYNCPYCEDRVGKKDTHGHLYVNNKKLTYICHRCGATGRISSSGYRLQSSIDEDELFKELRELTEERVVYKHPYKIPIDKVTNSKLATEYMISRGFSLSQLEYYDMRIGSYYDNMLRGRVIIPNEVYRVVYTDMYVARSFIGTDPKYRNPIGAAKSKILFNYHRQNCHQKRIIICEGVLTAIRAGVNAIALFGKYCSNIQLDKILSLRADEYVVNLDPDAYKESLELCDKLYNSTSAKVRNLVMPKGTDAADYEYREYLELLSNAPEYDPIFGPFNILNRTNYGT